MADPPPYDEIASGSGANEDGKGDCKTLQTLSIRDEVGASRSQHAAALVAKLLPQIRERAKSGLSRTTLVLLPSDQDISQRGNLVGFPQDERPILIQLEGRYDTTQFWTQDEALRTFQNQMLLALVGDMPIMVVKEEEPLPEHPKAPVKSSFWGRKQSQAPVLKLSPKRPQPPVTVEVTLDHVNFRTETEYGLYETIRERAVLMTVDVR